MACKTSYDLHHNFPRLAEETGFAFNTHRPRVHIDWNKIRLIDIESLARDRKFVLIEQHVNDILDCVLESEFDVRILDEGVVKLFRLAQLAVEYQQFCRHYLDRSVFVLRQEIDTLAQELASTKKDLQDKDEELRKLRRKGKQNYRPLLSYSNDNIATMILKTLTNKGEIFPSTAGAEAHQYNKCNFCDKVFLNQLYLKSHISRRHVNILDEVPQKDEKEIVPNEVTENKKLNHEINELKLRLKEMEILITASSKSASDNKHITTKDQIDNKKEMKDVEVSTSSTTNNDHVFEKLEEWKKTEQENHTKEINLLRNQIFETLNNFRVKERNKTDENDLKIIDHLRETIKEQGSEILALKRALTDADIKTRNEDKERKKEIAEQMLSWTKRDEAQSKQYELLLQKLNEVAMEARESRTLAEAERQRAEKLEAMLKEKLNHRNVVNEVNEVSSSSNEAKADSSSQEEYNNKGKKADEIIIHRGKPSVDQNTMERLHRKAQELLNMKSSSSSDISSAENINNDHLVTVHKNSPAHNTKKRTEKIFSPQNAILSNKVNQESYKLKMVNKIDKKITHPKKKRLLKKPSPVNNIQENGPILTPGSPMKVVRAKITEEVNNRLVQAGVDPLKSRLHHSIFQKQKSHLQQQLEIKTKKYPAYEQVRYTIMAYLDSDASDAKRDVGFEQDDANTSALTKAFSLSSMISNVKSKALSLVKSKESRRKNETKAATSELIKKAASLLKTPPESPITSNVRRSSPKSPVSQPEKDYSVNEKQNTETVTANNKTHLSRKTYIEKKAQSPIDDAGSDTNESNSPYKINLPQRPTQSIDNLIKSPARRPSSANADYSNAVFKYTVGNNDNDHLIRTQSVTNVSEFKTYRDDHNDDIAINEHTTNSNDDIRGLLSVSKLNKAEDSKLNSLKQTKGVLKNASSTSSLNKKKVIFDMDAIQMKSVSASPSQSLTEKSDEKYELGLVNIDNEEWDISSIENEHIKEDTKIHVRTGQSLKITELKQTIEAQLARRGEAPAALFGVDVLRGPGGRPAPAGGSNTSLGSSILDDSDNSKLANQKTLIKPKKHTEKDDSELDLSDFSIDGLTNKNDRDSF